MIRITALLSALALVASAGPASHYDMGPARRFEPTASDELNSVCPAGFVIDTRDPAPGLPAALLLDENEDVRQPCIVQFDGPVDRRWVRDLERLGFEPFGYIPHYATLCRLDPAERELVRSLPFVRWVGLYHPGWRIEPALLERDGPVEVVAALAPGGDGGALAAAAARLGRVVSVSRSELTTTVRLVLDARDLPGLARLPDLFWVQEHSEATVANNQVQWVVQTGRKSSAQPDTALSVRTSWARGVRGQGLVLSTTDTGLNTGHDMFRDPGLGITPPGIWPEHRKVVAFKTYQGASTGEAPYHGSHVNGTVAGDDSVTGGSSYYDGMAKDARLYFVDVSAASGSFVIGEDLWSLWDTVYFGRGLPDSLRPIKQHSGSWGWTNSQGTYLLQDASTDAFGFAHKDFLNIIAAGNESSTRRIRNPGIAKDVLTVGATQNGTAANVIASFSSRGPTQDGRRKPCVMAPGYYMWSARNTGTNTYSQMSGTSMATPAVNGTVGLMRCYLEQGFYPTGGANPSDGLEYISAAQLRAMAMVSADPNVGSYTVPDNNIGWGRVDADSVLYFSGDARKLALCDDTAGVATGQYKQCDFQVYSALPLRACLAWTDTAAAPGANPALVNDLNLELVSPTGVSYRGNQYSGGQSVQNPSSWDAVNVEECVRVNSPETGVWTIKVYGQNVATFADQPFAWCVTGDVSLNLPDVGVSRLLAPAGTIDSTASVAPACSVYNFGNVAASYRVRARVGAFYDDSADVTDHLPGTARYVAFPAMSGWPRGSHPVSCSTRLAGDIEPGNDSALGTVAVRVLDAVAVSIDAPTGVVYRGVAVQPRATVRNGGSATQAFAVAFGVADGYGDTVTTPALAPGASTQLAFADWTPATTGSFATGCTTRLAGDMAGANNRVGGSVTVHYRDVGVDGIVAPVGSYVAGDTVRPAATWHNHGTVSADFEAWMVISDPADAEVYRQKVDLAGLAPGDTVTVTGFPPLELGAVGAWTARCSTGYAGDQLADNDELEQGFAAVEPGIFDVAVAGITAPAGWVDTGSVVVPRGRVRNNSDRAVTCAAWLVITDPAAAEYYRRQVAVAGLGLGEEREVSFPACTLGTAAGTWGVRCSVFVARDTAPGNDFADRGFELSARPDWPFGWVEVARVPAGTKPVKDGAWLALDPATQLIYATRGNKTGEFGAYDPLADTWAALAEFPVGAEGKPPRKGSRGACDGSGALYATKGNNTFGFWKYDIATDRWNQLTDVPEGPSRKKVKGGTDLVYVDVNDTGWVYLMKGYRTEFYRYNTASGRWETLPDLPYGYKEKWDKGSWLAYDGGAYLYAQQAKYYNRTTEHHYMYRYDIAANTFTEVTGMPLWGLHGGKLRKKKSKDGGAGAYDAGMIYALKGGNTQQFFSYDCAQDTWTELDTMPTYSPTTGRRRRVKQGGDLAAWGAGVFFALKGNKTDEFWRYVTPAAFGIRPGRSGAMAGRTGALPAGLTVEPNPLAAGAVTLRYSLPKAGAASISVYDVTGRSVLSRSLAATRTGAVSLDVRSLSAGIYLVRLDANGYTATGKLIVER